MLDELINFQRSPNDTHDVSYDVETQQCFSAENATTNYEVWQKA